MIRTILQSDKKELTILLPDDLVGKTIEVLAFEIEKTVLAEKNGETRDSKIARLTNSFNNFRVDLSGFKFDRNEANDYE